MIRKDEFCTVWIENNILQWSLKIFHAVLLYTHISCAP